MSARYFAASSGRRCASQSFTSPPAAALCQFRVIGFGGSNRLKAASRTRAGRGPNWYVKALVTDAVRPGAAPRLAALWVLPNAVPAGSLVKAGHVTEAFEQPGTRDRTAGIRHAGSQ